MMEDGDKDCDKDCNKDCDEGGDEDGNEDGDEVGAFQSADHEDIMEAIWWLELVREVAAGFFSKCFYRQRLDTEQPSPMNYHFPTQVVRTLHRQMVSKYFGTGSSHERIDTHLGSALYEVRGGTWTADQFDNTPCLNRCTINYQLSIIRPI